MEGGKSGPLCLRRVAHSVAQAVKREARAVAPDNLGLLDLVKRLEPEPGDLVLQELVNTLADGTLLTLYLLPALYEWFSPKEFATK